MFPTCSAAITLARAVKHWKMSLPESLEELLEKRMNKKHRYWAKRTMRMLDKDFPGAVRYHCFSAPNEMGQLFEDAVKVARKTYQWGLGVGFQDNEEQRKRLALEATNGWLRGHVLYFEKRTGGVLGFYIRTRCIRIIRVMIPNSANMRWAPLYFCGWWAKPAARR